MRGLADAREACDQQQHVMLLSTDPEPGWKDAIIKVLKKANVPMHYVDIAEQIFEQNLRTAESANPTSSVAAIIAQSLSKEVDKSPFVRVGRGWYGLRETNKPSGRFSPVPEELTETGSSDITGVINAFGMFWDRSKVKWEAEPLILGQKSGAKAVNFCSQRGVYLLHETVPAYK